MKTLYICYMGLLEPLVQTQVLPYLRELATAGIEVTLLTFESQNWSAQERQQSRDRLKNHGIEWLSLRYHKRPSLPATMYDIAAGALLASRLVRQRRIDVLHARSHVPAAIAALTKKFHRCKLLFDVRGFFPEEYVDAGIWPAGGLLYRVTKRVEKELFASADACIVLTKRAHDILREGLPPPVPANVPIEVIPCCVDFDRFAAVNGARKNVRGGLKIGSRRVFVYVGAMGGWYLSEQMADFLAAARQQDPSAFALVLTQSSATTTAGILKQRGLREEDFDVRTVEPAEIAEYLSAADVAFCFIKPSYSKVSSSPTKIGEYLASGLPVICNAGIGDVDDLLLGERVGVVVRGFTREAYLQAIYEAEELSKEPGIAERCRAAARKHFDLQRIGGARYVDIYSRIGDSAQKASSAGG